MWGGEFLYLLLLGCSAAMIAVLGWSLAMAATPARPRSRVRGVFSLGFMVLGYSVGGLLWLLNWQVSRWPTLAWAAAGLLVGFCIGNVIGRVAWVWLKSEDAEAVS
jgi:hypothetical protein